MSIPVKLLVDSLETVDAMKVAPNSTAEQAYNRAVENQVHYLLVMDDKKFVGIISLRDIVKAKSDFGLELQQITVNMVNIFKCEAVKLEDDILVYEEDFASKFPYGIYVEDGQGNVVGLITQVKLTNYLLKKHKAEIAAGNIENTLKSCIAHAYKNDTELRAAIVASGFIENTYNQGEVRAIANLFNEKQASITPAEIEDKLTASFSANRALSNLSMHSSARIIEENWLDFINYFRPMPREDWGKLFAGILEISGNILDHRSGVTLAELNKVIACDNWLKRNLASEILAYNRISKANEETSNEHSLEDKVISALKLFINYLNTQKNNTQGVNLEVSQVAGIIGIGLPEEAFLEEGWWTKETIYSKQWISVGWKVAWASFDGGYKKIAFEPVT